MPTNPTNERRVPAKSTLAATVAASLLIVGGVADADFRAGPDTTPPGSNSESSIAPAAGDNCEGVEIEQIGYSPLTMQFDYFRFTVQGMETEAAKCGIEVVTDDPNNDAAAQVSGIESLLAGGADVIAITSIDPEAIQTAVQAARDQGAIVLSQVSTFEGADAYVGLPESEFGRLQANLAAEALKELKPDEEEYQIAILNADSLGEGLLERKDGLIEGLEEVITNYEIVADVEAYEEETALSAIETIIQGNPDLDLILTVNDPGSLGARSAVQASSLALNEDVIVGGLGIDRRVLEGVLTGDFPGTVSPEPVATGEALVRAAIAISRGEDIETDIQVPPVQITTENAQEYIDLLYPE